MRAYLGVVMMKVLVLIVPVMMELITQKAQITVKILPNSNELLKRTHLNVRTNPQCYKQ